ncbi:3-oxoacyl-[acyl-carrier-protein] reductase FabG [Roseimaritima multifibrata]|uniref:3-oxoacyl-[acyl-carrier-protein] reductase FabG n=1 Tax=Roseimaritima multifibrata TaxID=1930274 RepID=A0A517MEL3_9BACT|nr:SDR family oxidoreductase [Roseimaritima multifibrata]QDS93334.1 3-oxoacyl-[acyl-carrier-protein] reductase FabG [Roseimaritima multifibrata]
MSTKENNPASTLEPAEPTDTYSACVITGGSSGIGRAIALHAALSGFTDILIHYRRNHQGAAETVAALEQTGATAQSIAIDLAEPDAHQRLADAAWKFSPTISAWFHNAGVDVLTGDAKKEPFETKLQRLWQVDVHATILLAREVADRMLAQPKTPVIPSMLFTGWDQATAGMEGDAGQMFGPTKAAIMAFSRSLAQTLAPEIRVNCVAPGWIQTAWGDNADSGWQRRAQQQSLMHRWGTPEDVAAMAVHLCSANSGFITGQIVEVNGGWNRKPS